MAIISRKTREKGAAGSGARRVAFRAYNVETHSCVSANRQASAIANFIRQSRVPRRKNASLQLFVELTDMPRTFQMARDVARRVSTDFSAVGLAGVSVPPPPRPTPGWRRGSPRSAACRPASPVRDRLSATLSRYCRCRCRRTWRRARASCPSGRGSR